MQTPSTLGFRISNLEDLINDDLLKFGNNELRVTQLHRKKALWNICGFLLRKADVYNTLSMSINYFHVNYVKRKFVYGKFLQEMRAIRMTIHGKPVEMPSRTSRYWE